MKSLDKQRAERSITFSFGDNWSDFVQTIDEETIERAKRDIEKWLGEGYVRGKRVLDIGCGSGLHSLCYYQLGAGEVVSFDHDEKSVEATRFLWSESGRPGNWRVFQGSILDAELVGELGVHDIVYAWGVLHHTGSMWEAVENSTSVVGNGGKFWVALYTKGSRYEKDLQLKRRYNAAGEWGKKLMVARWILKLMFRRLRRRRNPFKWNRRRARGMSVYYDIIDWLGGLPYEVASVEEVVAFCRAKGLVVDKVVPKPEGGNSIYLFTRKHSQGPSS